MSKRVVRSDGRVYPSVTAAAWDVALSVPGGSFESLMPMISRCCNHRGGSKTAYGWGWEWADARGSAAGPSAMAREGASMASATLGPEKTKRPLRTP